MGFNNPHVSWHEIERALSDRKPARAPGTWWSRRDPPDAPPATGEPRRDIYSPPEPELSRGGDSPAWSPRRPRYEPPPRLGRRAGAGAVPYAELHCHSNFSFLDGASHPEELAE